MIREIVNGLAIFGGVLYFIGYIWSGVIAYRLKKYGWLLALLLGPLVFPFFAVAHRKVSRFTFHLFWIGLSIFVLCCFLLVVPKQA